MKLRSLGAGLIASAIIPLVIVCLSAEEALQTGGPRMQFDHDAWDFGKIISGAVVDHAFPFRNTGGDTLVILGVRASCGCTKSGTTSDRVGPGETAAIFAEFNSEGKRGHIVKSVFVTTNIDTEEITLTLDIHVLPDTSRQPVPMVAPPVMPPPGRIHDGDTLSVAADTTRRIASMMGSMERKPGQSIFDSPCLTCHVVPARGKFGADLYEAACAMCHGSDQHPVVHDAAAITSDLAYHEGKSLEYLYDKIASGTSSPMMPGFEDKHGGPLTSEQIRSLLIYFARIQISEHPAHHPPKFSGH